MTLRLKRRLASLKHTARQVRGKLRRFFLDKFGREQIDRCVKKRTGACRMCGKCCALVFRCPFLKREGDRQVCSIYRFRPAQCRHFPIDRRDLREVRGTCGYDIPEGGDDR